MTGKRTEGTRSRLSHAKERWDCCLLLVIGSVVAVVVRWGKREGTRNRGGGGGGGARRADIQGRPKKKEEIFFSELFGHEHYCTQIRPSDFWPWSRSCA